MSIALCATLQVDAYGIQKTKCKQQDAVVECFHQPPPNCSYEYQIVKLIFYRFSLLKIHIGESQCGTFSLGWVGRMCHTSGESLREPKSEIPRRFPKIFPRIPPLENIASLIFVVPKTLGHVEAQCGTFSLGWVGRMCHTSGESLREPKSEIPRRFLAYFTPLPLKGVNEHRTVSHLVKVESGKMCHTLSECM